MLLLPLLLLAAKCTSSSQCGAGKCCCDSECVASQVTLRLKGASDDDACEYTCLNRNCQKSGGPNQVCNCIKDCNGPNCSSAGGNPCKANGERGSELTGV